MTALDFMAWAADRTDGQRSELVDGQVFAMAPGRSYHARVKGRVDRRLEEAVEAAGLSCKVHPDGMAAWVNADTVSEPDVAIRTSQSLDPLVSRYDDPVLVAEVLSPSTRGIDTGLRLTGYFSLPSVRHYLLIRLDTRSVIHHERARDGSIGTRIVDSGTLRFDPPGIAVAVVSLFS